MNHPYAPPIDPAESTRLNAVQIDDFLAVDFPPRPFLLAPWMRTKSLSMLSAWRGTGKTMLSLGIGYAVSAGGRFLHWHAPEPQGVLYVDGEMAAGDMQSRLRMIEAASDRKADPAKLRIVTPDLVDGPMPDLSTEAGHALVNRALRPDTRLIVIDNLSCLARTGVENDAESWTSVASWALDMRRQGRSVLFIHHAGKAGGPRGTSKREDLLDTSIALTRPPGYLPSDGLRARMEFTKARGLHGDAVATVDVGLEPGPSGAPAWTYSRVRDDDDAEIERLYAEGRSVRQIADAVGLSKSQVDRKIHRLREGANAYRAASDGE